MAWSAAGVLAHGFADAGEYPVPVRILLVAGVLVVLAANRLKGRDDETTPSLARSLGPRAATVLRVLTLLLLVAIVLPAAFGSDDVAANPAPRLLFTVGWAGLLLVSFLLGPVWSRANPVRWATVPGARDHRIRRAGMWPAVAALVLFSLAEQVLDPSTLTVLVVVGVYVLVTMAGATLAGRSWFRAADPLDAASRLLGRMAIAGRRGRRLTVRSARAGVATADPLPGMAAFLGVLVAVSAYDAVAPDVAVGGRLALFVAAVGGGAAVFTAAARPLFFAPALIPVAAGHAGAHYLAPLLVDTQVAAVQASDPFALGWDLLGLTGAEIVAEPVSPFAGLTISYVLLVAGHALAMVVANDTAARHLGVSARAAGAALFPLRAAIAASLVVGIYTRLGGL